MYILIAAIVVAIWALGAVYVMKVQDGVAVLKPIGDMTETGEIVSNQMPVIGWTGEEMVVEEKKDSKKSNIEKDVIDLQSITTERVELNRPFTYNNFYDLNGTFNAFITAIYKEDGIWYGDFDYLETSTLHKYNNEKLYNELQQNGFFSTEDNIIRLNTEMINWKNKYETVYLLENDSKVVRKNRISLDAIFVFYECDKSQWDYYNFSSIENWLKYMLSTEWERAYAPSIDKWFDWEIFNSLNDNDYIVPTEWLSLVTDIAFRISLENWEIIAIENPLVNWTYGYCGI